MFLRLLKLLVFCCFGGFATQPSAETAHVVARESGTEAGWFGGVSMRVALSSAVPFRVFMLDRPARLVVDFKGLDTEEFSTMPFMRGTKPFTAVRMGIYEPGWTRLVADLSRPYELDDVEMQTGSNGGQSVLSLSLRPVSAQVFASQAGAPPGVRWIPAAPPPAVAPDPAAFVVVLDPGHGGLDPGAEHDGVSEKTLMLDLALRLAARLRAASGVTVYLTREADRFVSLDSRVALAQSVHADLFLSLHADALNEGDAQGATFYTLSEEASDSATAQLAARHNRADLLAGADLSTSEDGLTRVLLDIARRETDPRSRALAKSLVAAFEAAQVPVNSHPLREAGFSVLKSAEIPSVLVEVAFLSNPRDLANVQDPAWQERVLDGLQSAILTSAGRDVN